jgi:membrane protein DedA with SNARE-associated domain/rhodanese-related sulfurtransferase
MDLVGVLNQWGVPLVFGVVLLEFAGLPLGASAWLIVAGALSIEGPLRTDLVLSAAFAGALASDHAWFLLGRRHGRRLLETVCRISLSPDICVSRTDQLLGRYGPALLLFAKFIPGVSSVSIPTMAAMGVPYRRFLRFDAAGCAIWCGTHVGIGALFHRQIDLVLEMMHFVGANALAIAATLFAGYLALKLLHRRRLVRLHELARIAPEDVSRMLGEGHDLVILDARSQVARTTDPRSLPRSIVLEDPAAIASLPPELRSKTVVTFCTCPNEASAAFIADLLMKAGYRNVRVLTGGSAAIDALAAA